MKLLLNPMFIRFGVLMFIAVIAVVFAWLVARKMRQEMHDDAVIDTSRRVPMNETTFAAAAYQGVIQRLKEQEQELARLQQQHRERADAQENLSEAVLSNLSSGVLIFNRMGLLQLANRSARQILGYASPTGMHARQLFRGTSQVRKDEESAGGGDVLLDAITDTLERGSAARRLEADYATPGGQQRVLGITISPVRGPAGAALAACLVSDLTDIAYLSRQIRTQEQLASLGEMSAGIAHEFKNSLATISGYAQMLTGGNDATTVQKFAGKIVDETQNLTRIVTDFLNFAKPQRLQDEPVQPRTLLEECAQECAIELDAAGVPAELELIGDCTALRQAFSNLLRNSADAARDGARTRVQVTTEVADDAVRLVFSDNGSGIPQENLNKLFVPFFTTKATGTGLGLPLVHRIVTEHGGTVAVRSDSSGTVFTLSFPRRAALSAQTGAK